MQLEDQEALSRVFNSFKPNVVIHLAAQAGVRYSIDNPEVYVSSNLVGTSNLLEQVKKRDSAFYVCFDFLCLWRARQNAVLRTRSNRQPDVLLCRNKKSR